MALVPFASWPTAAQSSSHVKQCGTAQQVSHTICMRLCVTIAGFVDFNRFLHRRYHVAVGETNVIKMAVGETRAGQMEVVGPPPMSHVIVHVDYDM